tara:strand:+ start:127 stop:408 length:282 start_codon:yes stop_codon:yes gene_type:complete
MSNFDVSITKVFGASATKVISVVADNQDDAVEQAMNWDWSPTYASMRQTNLSDSYKIAEVVVNGTVVENQQFSESLLNEAVAIQKEWVNGDAS